MKAMKNFNFSKVVVIGLLIVIASLAAITFTAGTYRSGSQPNAVIKVINDGTGTADGLLSAPGNFLRSKVNDFHNALNAFSQNQNLKKKLSTATVNSQKLAALENENKKLKAALQLQDSLSNYAVTNAAVISRSPSSWSDTLIINKGSSSGLVANTLVMANGGIIGKIVQVNNSTSKVELLTSSNSLTGEIPIKIGDNPGFLMDFDQKSGRFFISNMDSVNDIKNGENVVTSGLDGHFPSDLMLGTVDEFIPGNSPYSAKIYVKPTSGFYDLQIVTVVTNK